MHKRAAIDPTVIVVCTRSRAAKATFSDAPFGRAQSSFAFALGGSIYLSETGSFYLSAVGNRGQPVLAHASPKVCAKRCRCASSWKIGSRRSPRLTTWLIAP